MMTQKDLALSRSANKIRRLNNIRFAIVKFRTSIKWSWLRNIVCAYTFYIIRWIDNKVMDLVLDDINHSPSLLKMMDE